MVEGALAHLTEDSQAAPVMADPNPNPALRHPGIHNRAHVPGAHLKVRGDDFADNNVWVEERWVGGETMISKPTTMEDPKTNNLHPSFDKKPAPTFTEDLTLEVDQDAKSW